MSLRRFRRLTVLAAVMALALPLGLAQAGATAPAKAEQARATFASSAPFPGAYLSPWGDADVAIDPRTQSWLQREGITLEAISPFKMHDDGKGFSMPIGSTAGDGLDAKGRIFYPGGLKLHHASSDETVTLKPTWIRVMPRPGYSAGVDVNGKKVSDETQIADTHYDEVMKSARPSPTGWRLEKVPFYFTQDAKDLLEQHTRINAPEAGTPFGTLSPNFDYIPTKPGTGAPGFPGF